MSAQAIEQRKWKDVIEQSAFTPRGVADAFGINKSSLRRWLRFDGSPNEKNAKKMEMAMKSISAAPKLTRHPSYGYATQEQIEALATMGIGPNRDAIIKQIERQTKTQGKVK